MKLDQSARNELVRSIEEVFATVPKPRLTLRVARAMDDNEYDQLGQRESDDGYYEAWSGVASEDIEHFHDVFPWLNPEGVRFYLPAYMVNALEKPIPLNGSCWLTSAFTVQVLNERCLRLFEPDQLQALQEFLELLFREEVRDDYFEDWWNHPWDPTWEYDQPKQPIWESLGPAYVAITTACDA